MKIIFADIDGVFNLIPQGRDQYGAIWHPHLVENLKTVIEQTGAKIVVSSTWRLSGESVMKDMWRDRNLPGEVIGVTPCFHKELREIEDFYERMERGKEIQAWLDLHPEVTNYVILDDDNDMLPSQQGNFVRTSNNINHEDCVDIGYGLTKICAQDAIRILNSK
jgi:hypothetical protein